MREGVHRGRDRGFLHPGIGNSKYATHRSFWLLFSRWSQDFDRYPSHADFATRILEPAAKRIGIDGTKDPEGHQPPRIAALEGQGG